MILLAGDIGGTTSRFQLLDTQAEPRLSTVFYYSSPQFPSFLALLETFFEQQHISHIDYACFGLPGPIADAEVFLTNLPWHISACELEANLPIGHVKLTNDFQAAALGVDRLEPQDILCLYAGEFDEQGNRLVIGAGTGLGVAPVYQLAGHFYPQASEGGHVDFAPLNHEQEKLLEWLHRDHARVSYEHLLSGDGLAKIYQFCAYQHHQDGNVPLLSAAQVHSLAENKDAVAVAALTLFVNIYGDFVGNAALLWPARGGIYVAGGIGAKIVRWMNSAAFTEHFLDKGQMRAVVAKMPVYLVLDELLGLKGALMVAQRMAETN